MSDPISIRRAVRTDAATIAEFNSRLAWETEQKRLDPPTIAAGVMATFDRPGLADYYVAEANGSIIGQLMTTKEWSDWRNGEIWWIQSVYVVAEFRGQGVYRSLHAEVRRLALAHGGVVGLRLYVEKDNERAQKTYVAVGMENEGYFVFGEHWSDGLRPM